MGCGWIQTVEEITDCQDPTTRMVRAMRIRDFMRSRTAKIKADLRIWWFTPHYFEVEDDLDFSIWGRKLSIVGTRMAIHAE